MDLAELVLRGNSLVRAHDEAPDLRASASSFLDCVAGWESFTVEAASPAAERVLGAAMMLNPDIRGGRSRRTVVLDVNIASGTLVANAARRVREAVETDWLIAVVVNSLTDADLRWNIDGVDSLFVCHHSSSSEGSQSAHDGVGVTSV
ncbi:hypothetical protein [Microbacterium sp. NPDC087665]|uniref:hypothetical protein n=1 Tax=Microbacterium sp. NPDC087665 TaxID=3364194 RepID=UPI0038245B88